MKKKKVTKKGRKEKGLGDCHRHSKHRSAKVRKKGKRRASGSR